MRQESGSNRIGPIGFKVACVLTLFALHATSACAQIQSVPTPELGPQAKFSLLNVQDMARESAGQPSVAGNFVVPLLAGVPTGFFLPMAVLGAPVGMIIGGLGSAIVGGTAYGSYHQDAWPDDSLITGLGISDRNGIEAFRSAYSARLAQRRFRASLLGGGIGVGIGFGALVWLLSQADF